MIFFFECQMAKEKYLEYATLSVETASCHVFAAHVLEIRSPDAVAIPSSQANSAWRKYTLRLSVRS